MATELSYVLLTPYTVMKSRTGGVIARLLSRSEVELVGARLLAPSAQFVSDYAGSIVQTVGRRNPAAAGLLSDYIRHNLTPAADGRRQRVMALLFRGEDAVGKISSLVGPLIARPVKASEISGETIRDTYADYVTDPCGQLRYFEPAVLASPMAEDIEMKLRLLADFADSEPNIVENTVNTESLAERTLVIIKPDNWRHPSTRPGNVIDMLSRTGLRIIGCKIYQMSVAEALEFYGPVKDFLRKKLAPDIGARAAMTLANEFKVKLGGDCAERLTEAIGVPYADDQFHQIIAFMSGRAPTECPATEINDPGRVKSMVLIYEGNDAVSKIRTVLGPTDPTKAPGGTVRGDFGTSVMVNTAHASDSPENARREMDIIKIQQNSFSSVIRNHLKNP
jgi:nucleoside diphosphate kinase